MKSLGLFLLIIASGTVGCRSPGENRQTAGSTIDNKTEDNFTSLFNLLLDESYYEKPKRRPRQFISPSSGFIAKQMFQMAAVTPKKSLGVVEFFDESGENLKYLPKEIAQYLTDAFKRTAQFKTIPPSMITKVFQEEFENRNLRLSDHDRQFDKIIARRALELGFNVLCLGTFIEAEIYKDEKTKLKSSSSLKLYYRIIALDTLSARIMSDFLGEFNTKLKTGQETIELKDLKVSMLDENHLKAFCNNLANRIMAELHTVEWFARIMETRKPDEESREVFILNTGEDSGVNIGDRLSVYRTKTAAIDPANGRYIFDKGTLAGELIITKYLDENRCQAVASSGIIILPDDLVVMKYWQH